MDSLQFFLDSEASVTNLTIFKQRNKEKISSQMTHSNRDEDGTEKSHSLNRLQSSRSWCPHSPLFFSRMTPLVNSSVPARGWMMKFIRFLVSPEKGDPRATWSVSQCGTLHRGLIRLLSESTDRCRRVHDGWVTDAFIPLHEWHHGRIIPLVPGQWGGAQEKQIRFLGILWIYSSRMELILYISHTCGACHHFRCYGSQ